MCLININQADSGQYNSALKLDLYFTGSVEEQLIKPKSDDKANPVILKLKFKLSSKSFLWHYKL